VRIFLDANILFSAAKSDGTMRGFLLQLRGYGHTLVADGYVVEETQRNLKMKFPQSLEDFSTLLQQVETHAGASGPLREDLARLLSEKDRPVLASAIYHRCQILLTGDKTHFGSLYGKCFAGVEVHAPASFALIIQK
jgi:predicted nucleic acid-binding protein